MADKMKLRKLLALTAKHEPEPMADGGVACLHCGGTGYAQGGTIAGPGDLEVDDDGDEDKTGDISEGMDDDEKKRAFAAALKRRRSA